MDSYLSSASGDVSSAIVDQLARTKGWTMFFSVMLWIGAVLLLIGGITMIGIGAFSSASGGAFDEMGSELGGVVGMIGIGVVYIVMAVVYIFPALKLSKFSTRCSALMKQPTETTLVAVLNEMRSFWKFVGIWMIIFISGYILIFIVAIAVGAMGAMGS